MEILFRGIAKKTGRPVIGYHLKMLNEHGEMVDKIYKNCGYDKEEWGFMEIEPGSLEVFVESRCGQKFINTSVNGWIPVSERMPTEEECKNKWFWITYGSRTDMQELEKILEEIDETIERYKENANAEAVDICYGMKVAKKIIRNHMNDGWIPVEKDLPKNPSEVWVVLESTYGTGYRTYSSARYLYFKNYGEGHWCDEHYGYLEWDKYSDGRGGSSEYKVIAWQPIAPYRPERSDNNDGE